MEATLWKSVQRLAPLAPRFVSVTYGADGSTRERTHNVVTRIQRETRLTGAPHLTCVGAPRGEILDIARQYWDQGIRHIVALRGDPPRGAAQLRAASARLRVRGGSRRGAARASRTSTSRSRPIRRCIPKRRRREFDLDNLKRKIDAGASRAITQFFYDSNCSCAFATAASAAGIHAPIVPGILPITRFPQVLRFAARCGATHSGVAAGSLRRAG